ncbi:MAG: hypothetical protein QOF21_1320 [Actinomycetota bacterium]|jgi:murein DD-endopeptidase MepM/ murein hydrolase activator NlpD
MRTNRGPWVRAVLALAVVTLIGGIAAGNGASAQLIGPTTTTTEQAVAPTTTAPPAKSGAQPKLVGGGGDDPGSTNGVIPPGYAKIIASVKRSRANNTGALIAALQPLVDHGMDKTQADIVGFGRFPVAGYTTFTDDWLNPRFTPIFHLHEGTDLFAPFGTPVRAPVDGVVRHTSGGAGGTAVYVRTVEGHEVYLAHLSGYSDVKPGQSVKVGDIVGFVGNTGNAAGGAAHVHFEIHPKGKGPVNPKPYLDQWVAQALQMVPVLLQSYQIAQPQNVVPQVLTEQLSQGSAIALSSPPRAQLAWASSANPTGGALRIAEVEAAVASDGVNWTKRAQVAEFQRQQAAAADAIARVIVRPLTPLGLRDVLGVR